MDLLRFRASMFVLSHSVFKKVRHTLDCSKSLNYTRERIKKNLLFNLMSIQDKKETWKLMQRMRALLMYICFTETSGRRKKNLSYLNYIKETSTLSRVFASLSSYLVVIHFLFFVFEDSLLTSTKTRWSIRKFLHLYGHLKAKNERRIVAGKKTWVFLSERSSHRRSLPGSGKRCLRNVETPPAGFVH